MTENKKEQALKYLMECDTMTEASQKAGIARKTLYNYINEDSTFFKAYMDLQRCRYIALSDEITDHTKRIIETLQEIADNPENSPRDRITACKELLGALYNIQRIGAGATQDIREDNFILDPLSPIF